MKIFLWKSIPFIIGFILQGEPALIFWLAYFPAQWPQWLWIFLIAYIISYGALIGYYLLGRLGNRVARLWAKAQPMLDKYQSRFPTGT